MFSPLFPGKKFRASSLFHLLEWNRLDSPVQQNISALVNEEEVYGLFLPVKEASSLNPQIATKEQALLYLHLQQHSHLPRYLTQHHPEKNSRLVTNLVLDGVLQIWWQGEFVSGSGAAEALRSEWLPALKGQPAHRLSMLSLQAIRYAFELKNLSRAELTMHLYMYGTIPWDDKAKEQFAADNSSLLRFLLSGSSPDLQQQINSEWSYYPSPDRFGWLSWERRGLMIKPVEARDETFKLYISPAVQDLPAVFQKAVPALTAGGTVQFKVGNSIEGILRPDKMVAYFDSENQLKETALQLKADLAGLRAHGVPFTSPLDQKGMLSWGIDPAEEKTLPNKKLDSWRTSVTRQFAEAITQAQSDGLSFEASLPLLQARLAVGGIDMLRWLPFQQEKQKNPIYSPGSTEQKI